VTRRCAGQARALGADRVLQDLHHDGLAHKKLSFDRLKRRGGGRVAFGSVGIGMPAVDAAHQVSHMQKGSAVQPDVDEGRLHTGQHTRHLAQVDIADQAALQ